jgi:predicted ATP-dependent serine protease
MTLGWENPRIFTSIGLSTPEVFPSEELRQLASGKKKYLPFSKQAAEALESLIKQVRKEYEADIARQGHRDEVLATGASDGVRLDQVEETFVRRIETKWMDINRVFGASKIYDAGYNVIGQQYGLPLGKVNLLGGEEGVGKTRWYTALMLHFAEDLDMKCGVYQGEMDAGEYKGLLMSLCRAMHVNPQRALRNIHVFRQEHHQSHCQKIKELGLQFFVWDSFPMLANSNTKDGIDDIVLDVKAAIRDQCAALMVVHLNERGQIKGNNHVRYMADGNFYMQLEPLFGDGVISLKSGKNRSGKRGEKAWFAHYEEALRVLNASEYNLREQQHNEENAPKKGKKAA